jgi:hypothetical protein
MTESASTTKLHPLPILQLKRSWHKTFVAKKKVKNTENFKCFIKKTFLFLIFILTQGYLDAQDDAERITTLLTKRA